MFINITLKTLFPLILYIYIIHIYLNKETWLAQGSKWHFIKLIRNLSQPTKRLFEEKAPGYRTLNCHKTVDNCVLHLEFHVMYCCKLRQRSQISFRKKGTFLANTTFVIVSVLCPKIYFVIFVPLPRKVFKYICVLNPFVSKNVSLQIL